MLLCFAILYFYQVDIKLIVFSIILQSVPSVQQQQELMNEAIEKAKRAAELQAKIQAQLANKPNLVRNNFLNCCSLCVQYFSQRQACRAWEARCICCS